MTWRLQSLWRELEAAESWLARGGAHYGETLYDSLGRDVANLMVATSLSAQLTRVQRVRRALADSGRIAERMIVEQLSGIDLSSIWRILLAAGAGGKHHLHRLVGLLLLRD